MSEADKPLGEHTHAELNAGLDESTGPLGGNIFELFKLSEEVENWVRGTSRAGAFVLRSAIEDVHNACREILDTPDEEFTEQKEREAVRRARAANRVLVYLREVLENAAAARALEQHYAEQQPMEGDSRA